MAEELSDLRDLACDACDVDVDSTAEAWAEREVGGPGMATLGGLAAVFVTISGNMRS